MTSRTVTHVAIYLVPYRLSISQADFDSVLLSPRLEDVVCKAHDIASSSVPMSIRASRMQTSFSSLSITKEWCWCWLCRRLEVSFQFRSVGPSIIWLCVDATGVQLHRACHSPHRKIRNYGHVIKCCRGEIHYVYLARRRSPCALFFRPTLPITIPSICLLPSFHLSTFMKSALFFSFFLWIFSAIAVGCYHTYPRLPAGKGSQLSWTKYEQISTRPALSPDVSLAMSTCWFISYHPG